MVSNVNDLYWLNEIKKSDISICGGKAANLGELVSINVNVPEGFVISTSVYDKYIKENGIDKVIEEQLSSSNSNNVSNIEEKSNKIMEAFLKGKMSDEISENIMKYYDELCTKYKAEAVAVRSSSIAEDLENFSFAGLQDTYLNVKKDQLLESIKKCWASLYTTRVITYRKNYKNTQNALKIAVVIQKMVRSEKSGVLFTVNPTNGKNNIVLEAIFGLGEAIVQGEVTPDHYIVNKSDLSIIEKTINQQNKMITRLENGGTQYVSLDDKSKNQKLTDDEIKKLSEVSLIIEKHYKMPMDIEWAIEGGNIYIVQARPITSISKDKESTTNANESILIKGMGASPGSASGVVKIVRDIQELSKVKEGDILVTVMTTPDMVPVMSIAKGIITDEGGMTCHAAIVSRELGIPCIVGTKNATVLLKENMVVSVDGTKGIVTSGTKKIEEETKPSLITGNVQYIPITATKVMVNVGIPEKAHEYSKLPVDGVGLMRVEFIFTSYIKEHPLYMIKQGRQEEFVNKLANGIAKVAEAFYPRPVIIRTSDFKTNEYKNMIGGNEFEPEESNPMIGWRGCSRYVSGAYNEAFLSELKAIKKVRDEKGLKNAWVMLPFVRTVDEVKEIVEMMNTIGLKRGPDFKLYLMAEVPSIVFMAKEFAMYCDGFSIGSNDLTQLIMGADRDSKTLGLMGYFDERNDAVKRAISMLIKSVHEAGKTISICGQAPSVYPEFTEFLIKEGIDTISLNPDTVITTIRLIASVEQKLILRKVTQA